MNGPAWLGLGVGVVIGLICAVWQVADLRRRAATGPGLGSAVRTAVRLAFLIAALVTVRLAWGTKANKYWLVGGLAAAYSVVFFWNLRQVLAKKK